MKNCFTVYKHTNVINNKVYIGITSRRPEVRWNNGYGYISNKHFFNSIKKYGWNNFRHEILLTGLSEQEAKDKEIELIAQYNSTDIKYGYNVSVGGNMARLGYKHNEASRKKMSENHADFKGANSTSSIKIICLETLQVFDSIAEAGRKLGIDHKGIHNVLRHKAKSAHGLHFEYLDKYDPNKEYDLSIGCDVKKMSESKKGQIPWNKGQRHKPESIEKMRKAKLGKKASEETKRKMSVSSLNNSNSKPIICIETGEIFPSISEAGRVLKINSSNISSVCKGDRKTVNKLHFEYYNEESKL